MLPDYYSGGEGGGIKDSIEYSSANTHVGCSESNASYLIPQGKKKKKRTVIKKNKTKHFS